MQTWQKVSLVMLGLVLAASIGVTIYTLTVFTDGYHIAILCLESFALLWVGGMLWYGWYSSPEHQYRVTQKQLMQQPPQQVAEFVASPAPVLTQVASPQPLQDLVEQETVPSTTTITTRVKARDIQAAASTS